jgi:VWFA-related protein
MTRRRLLSLVLAVAASCAFPVAAQQSPPRVPGAIRSQVTLVPIDVVVTDNDDRPVTNLTKDDFTILENGVRQTIAHFTLQTMAADTAAPAGSGPSTAQLRKVPTVSLTPQSRRTFVIVLGRGRLQAPSKSVDHLVRFVRQELLPQDLVAVMAWNRATDFTTDHENIARLLERFKKGHEGVESKMALRFSGLAAVYGGKEIPKNLQPDIDRIFLAPGAVNARHLPPGSVTDSSALASDARTATDGLMRMETDALGTMSALDQLQVDALTDLGFEEFVSSNAQTMQDLQNLYTAVEYLRYMDGEKHLLFFTEQGLFLPRLEHDKSLAAMANDARVTIDTFQAGGVSSAGLPNAQSASGTGFGADNAGSARGGGRGGGQQSRTGDVSRMFALSSLRNIAQMTGGRSSIHGDVGKALATLNDVTRVEYLLGFYPSNPDWDGKYRHLTVRVNRPGLKLSYRRGYYARASLQPFDRKAFLTYSRIASAAQYAGEVHDIKVRAHVEAVPAASGSGQETRVDLVIDPSRLPFAQEGGLHKAVLEVTTFYGDSRGRPLGDLWQTLEMNLREANWEKYRKDGIPFSTRVPMAASGQTFKIVVYSYDADLVGSVLTKIK